MNQLIYPSLLKSRMEVPTHHTAQLPLKSCTLRFEGLDWKERYDLIKYAMEQMTQTSAKEVCATFYFEEETLVELPYYFKQKQAHWVEEITLKLKSTPLGLWVSKLKNKQTGCALSDLPLHCVTHLTLSALEKNTNERDQFSQLWARKHQHVWSHLNSDEIERYLTDVEILSLMEYFSQEDLEYALGCFEWEEAFELSAETPHRIIKAYANHEKDGNYRAWVCIDNPRRRQITRYLWLTQTEALCFHRERY